MHVIVRLHRPAPALDAFLQAMDGFDLRLSNTYPARNGDYASNGTILSRFEEFY